jgi:hypothetical protein
MRNQLSFTVYAPYSPHLIQLTSLAAPGLNKTGKSQLESLGSRGLMTYAWLPLSGPLGTRRKHTDEVVVVVVLPISGIGGEYVARYGEVPKAEVGRGAWVMDGWWGSR